MRSQYISTLNNMSEIRKDDPNEVYKQPIPLDMINKFVGLDSRILLHDDTVQKQSFDQSYKNFGLLLISILNMEMMFLFKLKIVIILFLKSLNLILVLLMQKCALVLI